MKCIENKPLRNSILPGKHDYNPQLLQTIENLKRELAMRDTIHAMAYAPVPNGLGVEQVYYPSLTVNQKKITEQLACETVTASIGVAASPSQSLRIHSLSQMTYLVDILRNMVWEACDHDVERVRSVCHKVVSRGNDDVSNDSKENNHVNLTPDGEGLARDPSNIMHDVDYHGYHDDDDDVVDAPHPEPTDINRENTPETASNSIKLSFEQYVLTANGLPLYNNYNETKKELKLITSRYKELSSLIHSDDVAPEELTVIKNEIKLCKNQINEMKVLTHSLTHSLIRTHSLTHSYVLTHSLTHTYLLTHSFDKELKQRALATLMTAFEEYATAQ